MTLLVAMQATDGLAVISDRKETYAHGSPKNVKKCYLDGRGRFYVSFAGDGRLADGVLRGLAGARTGPADVLARIRSIARALHAGQRRKAPRADGFLIVVDRQKPRLYGIGINGGHVDALEERGVMSAHGDGRARALCEYIAKKAGLGGMPCAEAAWHLHVLASDVAEHVESVGERGEYGFDLVLFAADGGARLFDRRTEQLGWIDVRFRPVGPPAARGRDAP